MSLSPSLCGHSCPHILSGEGQRPPRQRDAANQRAWVQRGPAAPTPGMNPRCGSGCTLLGVPAWADVTEEQPSSLAFFDNQLSGDSHHPPGLLLAARPPARRPRHSSSRQNPPSRSASSRASPPQSPLRSSLPPLHLGEKPRSETASRPIHTDRAAGLEVEIKFRLKKKKKPKRERPVQLKKKGGKNWTERLTTVITDSIATQICERSARCFWPCKSE